MLGMGLCYNVRMNNLNIGGKKREKIDTHSSQITGEVWRYTPAILALGSRVTNSSKSGIPRKPSCIHTGMGA